MNEVNSTRLSLFDTHCHLDFACFESQFSQMWLRAQQHGIQRAVVPSIGPENWQKVQQLAQDYDGMYYSLGFHPAFLTEDFDLHLMDLHQRLSLRDKRCVAIGECGLDKAIGVPQALQEKALLAQFALAREFLLPVVLHSRSAHNRLIQLVKQAKLPKGGVIHAFSGSYQQGMEWIKLGFYLGVGGTVTYPRAQKTRTALSHLPIEYLVLETDAPDMPLDGLQGQLNEPKNTRFVLETIASLRNSSVQSFAVQVWKNSNALFELCE